MRLFSVLLAILLICVAVTAVDRKKFRTCSQARFCNTLRSTSIENRDAYVVENNSVDSDDKKIVSILVNEREESVNLDIIPYLSTTHIRLTERDPKEPKWESPDVITKELLEKAKFSLTKFDDHFEVEIENKQKVIVHYSPFKLKYLVDGKITIVLNSENLLHVEPLFTKAKEGEFVDIEETHVDNSESCDDEKCESVPISEQNDDESDDIVYGEDGKIISGGHDWDMESIDDNEKVEESKVVIDEFSETFDHHTDHKKYGSTFVGLDIEFNEATHLFGLPEHASSLALKITKVLNGKDKPHYSDPYRLYNLDVFEYELDEPMALYGSVPFMIGRSTSGTFAGAFLNNPSEMFVDIVSEDGKTPSYSHWMAESGVIDLFLVPGPSAQKVLENYSTITGRTQLPPAFSLGFHQCRWNYRDEDDVDDVLSHYESLNIPMDVLWLDIEHTDGKRYFTWDKHSFPEPLKMQERVAATGRKMVTIVDPHIKVDSGYHVHKDAESKGLYVKQKEGNDFHGHCWPGNSAYPDFTSAKVREWWASMFHFNKYSGSSNSLFTWNDMNEPSVFNGPEVSMKKDSLNLEGVEHREWHNLYGFYHHMATMEGQIVRHAPKIPSFNDRPRPFVLTRAFYAGTQRLGAIWTGDNAADWDHLAISAPMVMSIGLGGIPFAGADVGGFFGNPDAELMTRWFQAGAYMPFFRAHAHMDTERREPWLFGEEPLQRMRKAILERYSLLGFWYTLFFKSSQTGAPVMEPLWMEFPEDEIALNIEDQWLIGSTLMVKPVTTPGANKVMMYFPKGMWYNTRNVQESPIVNIASGDRVDIDAPLDEIPSFQRGGSIIPKQMRVRRSTEAMVKDPYTLYVALDDSQRASGSLFIDDWTTFGYLDKKYVHRSFKFFVAAMTNKSLIPSSSFSPSNPIDAIHIRGLKAPPTSARVTVNGEVKVLEVEINGEEVIVRTPKLLVAQDWTIVFKY